MTFVTKIYAREKFCRKNHRKKICSLMLTLLLCVCVLNVLRQSRLNTSKLQFTIQKKTKNKLIENLIRNQIEKREKWLVNYT